MDYTTYEVPDENLIKKIIIRSEQGFLALIDGEIEPSYPNSDKSIKPEIEYITRFITGFVLKNKTQKQDDEISEAEIEAYKEKYPNDEFVISGCIFESLK